MSQQDSGAEVQQGTFGELVTISPVCCRGTSYTARSVELAHELHERKHDAQYARGRRALPIRAELAVQHVAHALYELGETGATVQLGGRVPSAGTVVAVPGHELTLLPSAEHYRTAPSALLRSAVRSYVADKLAELDSSARALGAWLDDDGRVVLDVVEVFAELADGFRAGAARGETAVYCLDNGRTYYSACQTCELQAVGYARIGRGDRPCEDHAPVV